MILPTKEVTDTGRAELLLMTNNECGMGFLAGHLTKHTHMTAALLPNLIKGCLSPALMATEMCCCSPHLFLCRFCHPS